MRVTDFTKKCLAVRRESRDLKKQGYKLNETDWEILRGCKYDHVILDAKISICGKYVWTKIGIKNG